MLSDKLNTALNLQMNQEFFSAYFYLGLAAKFDEDELPGFANFFYIQAREELDHAMRVFQYIHKAGGTAKLGPVREPDANFDKPLDAFKMGLANEQSLAKQIDQLLDLSITEKHAPTRIFLQWFVSEQVEEEALFVHCLKRVEMVGNDGQGILMLDKDFAARKPEEPAQDPAP